MNKQQELIIEFTEMLWLTLSFWIVGLFLFWYSECDIKSYIHPKDRWGEPIRLSWWEKLTIILRHLWKDMKNNPLFMLGYVAFLLLLYCCG